MEKAISVGIQHPAWFVREVLQHRMNPESVPLDLVRVVEKEYSGEPYDTPGYSGGPPAFLNESIQNELKRYNQLVHGLEIKLVSNGYRYSCGALIESGFIFTPTDREKLPAGFPYNEVDVNGTHVTATYASPPWSWKTSSEDWKRKKYNGGWLQLRIGVNLDTKGRYPQTKQLWGVVRSLLYNVLPERPSLNREVSSDEKVAGAMILNDMVKLCQLVEHGVNTLHTYTLRRYTAVGDVQLAYVYPGNQHQALFASGMGLRGLAKSYDIIEDSGTRVFNYYLKTEQGAYKPNVPKEGKGKEGATLVFEKPVSHTGLSQKQKEPNAKPPVQHAEARPTIFADVIGADAAKKELMRIAYNFKNQDECKMWGISQQAGVLLYGSSGTGKTLLARSLAHEADAVFREFKCSQVISKYVGDSESNLERFLDEAKSHERCVVLMDEIDSIGRKRELSDGSSHGTEGRMVNILLDFLDGFQRHENVCIVGTTNRKGVIDDALLQRLHVIEVPLPDFAARKELVRQNVEKHKSMATIHPFSEIDYDAIAHESEGLSGRELVGKRQGILMTLLNKARELTKQNGERYLVSTQDWIEEIRKLIPEEDITKGIL